jgi:hypothetical protein
VNAAAVVISTTPLWYVTRATAIVSLVLLTVSVVLGILVSVRFVSQRWPRFVTIGVHRSVSLMVIVFLTLHILTAIVDPYAPVGWLSVVVPFVSSYRPLWLGFGTVAFDLLIALVVTSLLRTRIGHRTWRVVHWAAYACWPIAIIHGLGTGSDAMSSVILGITVVCVLSVLGTLVWRLVSGWPAHRSIRIMAAVASVLACAVVVVWSLSGPLEPGWAARAGTPASLLARAAAASSASPSPQATTGNSAPTQPALPLRTAVTGTIDTSNSELASSTVTIDGVGTAPVAFHVAITGMPQAGGGLQMTSSEVTFGPTGQPSLYSGQVTGLDGTDIRAVVTDAAGQSTNLDLNLTSDGSNVAGTLAASSRSSR